MKEEGWWLVLGDVDTHELLALKRISFADHTTARLTFPVVNGAGRNMAGVTLYLVSDSYLGLDQQYFVPVPGKQKGKGQAPAHSGAQQSQGAAGSDAGTASDRLPVDNAADITQGVSGVNLSDGQSSTSEADMQPDNKGQRNNARRRHG